MKLSDLKSISQQIKEDSPSKGIEEITDVIELIEGVDDKERQKYAHEVFELLQKSYQSVGGITAPGFKNANDMQENVQIWVLYIKEEEVLAAVMYKVEEDEHVQRVAVGTVRYDNPEKLHDDIPANKEESVSNKNKREKFQDSAKENTRKVKSAKDAVAKILTYEHEHESAYSEISGPSLRFLEENVFNGSFEKMKKHLVPVEKVSAIVGKPVVPVLGKGASKDEQNSIRAFEYTRHIGGKEHVKVMIGLGYLEKHKNSKLREIDTEIFGI
jgi:hypothetical protein